MTPSGSERLGEARRGKAWLGSVFNPLLLHRAVQGPNYGDGAGQLGVSVPVLLGAVVGEGQREALVRVQPQGVLGVAIVPIARVEGQ